MAETIGWPYPVLYTGCSEMSLMKIVLYSTINHSDSLIVAIQPLASLSLSLFSLSWPPAFHPLLSLPQSLFHSVWCIVVEWCVIPRSGVMNTNFDQSSLHPSIEQLPRNETKCIAVTRHQGSACILVLTVSCLDSQLTFLVLILLLNFFDFRTISILLYV